MNTLLAFCLSFLFFTDLPSNAVAPLTAIAPLTGESPRVTHFQAPSYPEMAWQAKVHGKVVLKILVHKDGRFGFTDTVAGPPALVSAAKENLCSWTFASNQSEDPLPLTVAYEYRIDTSKASAQLSTEVTYDFPNHVPAVPPDYSPPCFSPKNPT